MVIGYIDRLASMVLCGSRLGICSMRGQGYRDSGDYLHCGGALEYPFVFLGICAYCLLHMYFVCGGYIAHIGVSMDHQEELYDPMAEAITS